MPGGARALEAYAQRFDDGFGTLAQRRAFRAYLQGLLLPRDRNKTLTALAETEPVVGAQHPAAQQLQYFLSEATWDAARSTRGAWRGSWPTPPPGPTPMGCSSWTTRGTGRTAPRPPTSPGSTWGSSARWTTASWP